VSETKEVTSAASPGWAISAARNSKKPSSCSLERAYLDLEPTAEPLHPAEHSHRVPRVEAAIEELDVTPHARVDPAARVGELEREERGSGARASPLLFRDRVDALDDPVLGELGDRGHGWIL
jgi:hypothetical protein